MSVRGKKTRNPGYQPGNHWVECDICAHVIRSRDARETWDGLVVCPDDWEPRHEQDFVRGVSEDTSPKGLVRPESTDTFKVNTYGTVEAIPSGTFDEDNAL